MRSFVRFFYGLDKYHVRLLDECERSPRPRPKHRRTQRMSPIAESWENSDEETDDSIIEM